MTKSLARLSYREIFGWPVVLAAVTALGLVSALLGDGVWDVASWLTLGAPLAALLHRLILHGSRPN